MPSLPASVKPLLAAPLGRAIWSADGSEFEGVEEKPWKPPATITPEQREDCRQALVALTRYLQPAPPEYIGGRVLGALAHHFVPNMPAKVQSLVADDWLDDLAEFPAWAIDEAFRKWRRMEEKKPTIAGIRDLCHRAVKKARQDKERLEKILAPAEPTPAPNVLQLPRLRRMGDD